MTEDIELASVADRLVWVDCEMTGLDLASDALIEIAALVTDGDLNVLGDGIDLVIGAPETILTQMPPVVAAMHAKSGLTDEVRASTVSVADAEQAVLDYVRTHVAEPRTALLAGNSIATDRGFITRDMPALDAFLHYRMIDVSSIKELSRRWFPGAYQAQPPRAWPIERSPTSPSPSASWRTTARRYSCRPPARPWPRPRRSPPRWRHLPGADLRKCGVGDGT